MIIRLSNDEVKQEERYAFAKGFAFACVCMIDFFRFKGRTEKLAIYLLRRANLKLGCSFREVLRTGQLQIKADELSAQLKVENPTPEQKKQTNETIAKLLEMRRAARALASEGAD